MGSSASLKVLGPPQASAGGLSAASDIRVHGATPGTWNQTGPSLNPASTSQWTTQLETSLSKNLSVILNLEVYSSPFLCIRAKPNSRL